MPSTKTTQLENRVRSYGLTDSLIVTAVVCAFGFHGIAIAGEAKIGPRSGVWHSWLDSPGGELPFSLEISQIRTSWTAWIVNDPERIKVPTVTVVDGVITLGIDYYDSTITAKTTQQGKRLDGEWKKRGAGDRWVRLPFHAELGRMPRFRPDEGSPTDAYAPPLKGRWNVQFEKTAGQAIGEFEGHPNGTAEGTILTLTGDYRYLSGNYQNGRLRLSCFDGAHAFLFDAHMVPLETLQGDFWSGDHWHETWQATEDRVAQLPSGFKLTKVNDRVELGNLVFPDLNGKMRSLDDPAFAGKARIIELFGSWCPNCHDAAVLLAEIDRRYRKQGLSVLGLAFEYTGNFERDVRQVRRFLKRHKATFPVLIAGLSDKDKASEVMPILDRVRAFPTTIFIDGHGKIRAVYSGFSGPATKELYIRLRWQFEQIIKNMLLDADEPASGTPTPK